MPYSVMEVAAAVVVAVVVVAVAVVAAAGAVNPATQHGWGQWRPVRRKGLGRRAIGERRAVACGTLALDGGGVFFPSRRPKKDSTLCGKT